MFYYIALVTVNAEKHTRRSLSYRLLSSSGAVPVSDSAMHCYHVPAVCLARLLAHLVSHRALRLLQPLMNLSVEIAAFFRSTALGFCFCFECFIRDDDDDDHNVVC